MKCVCFGHTGNDIIVSSLRVALYDYLSVLYEHLITFAPLLIGNGLEQPNALFYKRTR